MYRAFQIRLADTGFAEYQEIGRKLSDRTKATVKTRLDTISEDGEELDGTRIRNSWFPQIEADVFISHSHADRELATGFAGWLKRTFHLRPFVDSCVWRCADDLISVLRKTDIDRDGAIAHANVMLATALSTMLDSTECLFFLNTPNSLVDDTARARTVSPWIFYELSLLRFLRQNISDRRRKDLEVSLEAISYEVAEGDQLPHLTSEQLLQWQRKWQDAREKCIEKSRSQPLGLPSLAPLAFKNSNNALDMLYAMPSSSQAESD